MPYNSFEDLDVWKRACLLAVKIHKSLQACRDFALRDQMNRAAVSIVSNIAEGAERKTKAEYIHFLHIAKGSAAELRAQVYIAREVGLYQSNLAIDFIKELKEISSMLQGLIKSLTRKNLTT